MTVTISEPRARQVTRNVDLQIVLLALLTIGTFALRLSQLHQSLYGDEVWTYQDVVGHSLGTVVSTVYTGSENSPPLFFIFAWLSAKLGDPAVLIRLPTLLLGTATIPLVYLLGRDTVGRSPALIGAAVIAASPFAAYYGVEARPYTTMAFFVALSTLAVVRAVRSSALGWWLIYALAAAAAAYSHYTAVFALAVQAAWSLWACRTRLREPVLANVLIALLYIPWLPHIRGKSLLLFGQFEPLTAHHVLTDMIRLIPGYPYASLSAIPTAAGLMVIGAFALAGLVAAGLRYFRRPPGGVRAGSGDTEAQPPRGTLLIAAVGLATPIGVLLYSILSNDIWTPRVQYASLPALALLLGALLWALPRVARAVAVAAVLITLLLGTLKAISPTYSRPPYRAAARSLDRMARPGDPIVLDPITWGISVYLSGQHRVLSRAPGIWRSVGAGQTAYLVFNDKFAAGTRIGPPHPSGFALTLRRNYPSPAWGFTLLGYRRLAHGL